MCNAWNHRSGCTCGWGGEGHSGGGGGGRYIRSANLYSHYYTNSNANKNKISFDTFVNPNATCPVCGAEVFYYESPDGGKVYFDSLGPPWPKHPCTDNGPALNTHGLKILINSGELVKETTGWEPFIIKSIFFNKGIIKISGESLSHGEIDLFVENTDRFPQQSSLRFFSIQAMDENSFTLSTFIFDEISQLVLEKQFIGYKEESYLIAVMSR